MPDGGLDLARSRAVLIGTGTYTHLPPVPAAAHSLARMRTLLTGDLCGWPAESVTVFADERDPGGLPHTLVEQFLAAQDVALFYYVGHGQVDPDDNLCLALVNSRTEAELRRTSSLPFDGVRYALRLSRARAKIVILDCCYAGLAAQPTLSSGDLSDLTRGTGAYTLAAAGEFSRAWFETDDVLAAPQTFFTKYLADVVERGLPGRGPELTLEPIFHEAAEALARDGKPVPTSRASGHAARLVFARNAASGPAIGAADASHAAPVPPHRPTAKVSDPKAIRDPGLTSRIITARVWARIVVREFEEGLYVITPSGLAIPRANAISVDPEFAFARDLSLDLASELQLAADDLIDELEAAGASPADPAATAEASALQVLRRASETADKLSSNDYGTDSDAEGVATLIAFGNRISRDLEQIPLDVSGADLAGLALADAEATWLAGVIWNTTTVWPPGVASKMRAASSEIGPNTFLIAGDPRTDGSESLDDW